MTILFFGIGNLAIAAFLGDISYPFIVPLLFFFNPLLAVFLEVSQLVSLVTFGMFTLSLCQQSFNLCPYFLQVVQVPLY